MPFLRPAALATDTSPGIDAVIHAVEFHQSQGENFTTVCLLQPTNPLRTAAQITAAVRTFTESEADSLISVRRVPHQYNPHWTFKSDAEGKYLHIATGEKDIISRRQELPPAYHRDGSIYLVNTEILLQRRSLYGDKIAFFVNEGAAYVNIDTEADWREAERVVGGAASSAP